METRANYVLIGAFTLAGFAGLLGFFLWFANVQLDRQFAYYDIDFRSVSGLSDASDVRFSGLPVGQVVEVRLSPDNPGRVRVRIEIDATTPVKVDTVATIEAQGVTGVSYVGLTPGSPQAPLLADRVPADTVPRIEAGQSVLQSLSEDAPEIIAETLAVVRDLRDLIGGENQRRVETILTNVEDASAAFAQALDDFSEVSGTVSDFATEIEDFNRILDALTADTSQMLATAETTLGSIDALAIDARAALAVGTDTLTQATDALATAETYITADLAPATQALSASVAGIEDRFDSLGAAADGLIATYAETGRTATRRLSEAEETLAAANAMIARMDATLVSVDDAAQSFDGLIADGATPLVAELRAATAEATGVIADLGTAAETDLPAILADIRSATDRAAAVVDQVGGDLSAASGRIDGLAVDAGQTLDSARETFANANRTLDAINGALVTGESALASADRAFSGADRIINDEAAELARSLRETLASLESTVAAVADEIPGVTGDLRAASRSAETAFAQMATAVDDTAPAISRFSTTALPQYARLAAETRALIDNLDRLVQQISRDPSRFFLDPRAPEFRR